MYKLHRHLRKVHVVGHLMLNTFCKMSYMRIQCKLVHDTFYINIYPRDWLHKL